MLNSKLNRLDNPKIGPMPLAKIVGKDSSIDREMRNENRAA